MFRRKYIYFNAKEKKKKILKKQKIFEKKKLSSLTDFQDKINKNIS